MFTNVIASGELFLSFHIHVYVVGIIELYLFWSTIKLLFTKKDRKEYGRCAAHLGC